MKAPLRITVALSKAIQVLLTVQALKAAPALEPA